MRGNGQHENLGDLFFHNTALSYALRKLGKYPNLSVVAELNNRWALKDDDHAEGKVFNSGGTSVFITPGVVANITKNLSGFWGVAVPIYQDLGGEHEKTRLETKAGVSLHF